MNDILIPGPGTRSGLSDTKNKPLGALINRQSTYANRLNFLFNASSCPGMHNGAVGYREVQELVLGARGLISGPTVVTGAQIFANAPAITFDGSATSIIDFTAGTYDERTWGNLREETGAARFRFTSASTARHVISTATTTDGNGTWRITASRSIAGTVSYTVYNAGGSPQSIDSTLTYNGATQGYVTVFGTWTRSLQTLLVFNQLGVLVERKTSAISGVTTFQQRNLRIAGSTNSTANNFIGDIEWCAQWARALTDSECEQLAGQNLTQLYRPATAPYGWFFDLLSTAGATAVVTGTITASTTEADVVAGGKTIIITLTGDTWVAGGAGFDAIRADIIQGLDSAQSEALGWNAKVRDLEVVGAVVRTSNTVVTITLTASATYDITAQETITVTVPASAVVLAAPITATPTFTVAIVSAGRTTRNTRSAPLGMEIGMNWRSG